MLHENNREGGKDRTESTLVDSANGGTADSVQADAFHQLLWNVEQSHPLMWRREGLGRLNTQQESMKLLSENWPNSGHNFEAGHGPFKWQQLFITGYQIEVCKALSTYGLLCIQY